MKSFFSRVSALFILFLFLLSCSLELLPKVSSHDEMIRTLKRLQRYNYLPANPFTPKARLSHLDSLLSLPDNTPGETRYNYYQKSITLLELGKEKEAIRLLERLAKAEDLHGYKRIRKDLAMAYLRLAERSNCISNHASASCILPIRGVGVHNDPVGSQRAKKLYEEILHNDPSDLESRWLLNIAYMTLGEYPDNVPRSYLIPDLEKNDSCRVNAFEDIAGDLEINVNSMSGGSITDDFNNDGYLDIIVSSWGSGDNMQYFKNNGKGTFSNVTARSGLSGITGGLNILQTDYNNDGYVDVFVLRGAWKRKYGEEPNSLLKNNGDGTFTDVTVQSGLLSFHPTQTATWNDFNNDGWLDLFVGNESVVDDSTQSHPCELFINNQDGTFTDVAIAAKCDVISYVKGVTSGDYNNDGWQDIFISTLDGSRRLLKNKGLRGNQISFENVAKQAGLEADSAKTFTTWFWDHNNDGWLDIFTVDYSFEKSLAHYAAAEKLNISTGNAGKILLYQNNQDGTFDNVSDEAGLDKIVFSMGGNFGDIDNDGFLDMYLGTGNPRYQSVIPNKMFKNFNGNKFIDVTSSARVGHLQKGHGVSFADMDNDGDQDLYVQMGGAYPGDSYHNSFFLNPGQNSNNWITIALTGVESNRAGIGSRVKISFKESGTLRTVYRDVNSGGSFGSSPLRLEVGLGSAENIELLEIHWNGTHDVQTFHNIKPNQFLRIQQGKDKMEILNLNKIKWILPDRLCYPGQIVGEVN